jgi:hypothetical protein
MAGGVGGPLLAPIDIDAAKVAGTLALRGESQ